MKEVCAVCGNEDLLCGVACSGLGAISFTYCYVCLGMGAEPLELLQEVCGEPSECVDIPYYNKSDDKYYSYKTREHLPIKTQCGRVFQTRTEYAVASAAMEDNDNA